MLEYADTTSDGEQHTQQIGKCQAPKIILAFTSEINILHNL